MICKKKYHYFIFIFVQWVFCVFKSYSTTQLPLPRFVSLRASKVNLYVGPGKNYPIQWLYVYQYFPVEVIAEFDIWRQIRDFQGTEGWVHKSMLSGKRYCIVMHQTQTLRQKPNKSAKPIAYVEMSVVGKLQKCQGEWCKIEVEFQSGDSSKLYEGWLPRNALWGIYPFETKM